MPLETRVGVGIALIAIGLAPPVAGRLEASLIAHLLGQYSLLVSGGVLIGQTLARRAGLSWTAAPALLAGVLALLFWLIPRWIDAALADPATDVVKAATLMLLAGLPLGWGWTLAWPVLRAFVWANAVAMLAIMGWLQLAVPQRLCNSYLLSEQTLLGQSFLGLAVLVMAMGAVLAVACGREFFRNRGNSDTLFHSSDGLSTRPGGSW